MSGKFWADILEKYNSQDKEKSYYWEEKNMIICKAVRIRLESDFSQETPDAGKQNHTFKAMRNNNFSSRIL